MSSPARFSHLAAAAVAERTAPVLFSDEDLPPDVLKRMKHREQKQNDWTAARLFSQKRAIYDVLVRMLGAGLHVRLIADLCQVSEKSVVAVRDAEPAAVTAFREQLGLRRRRMMSRLADNLAAALEMQDHETGAKIAKDLAIAWNILDGQDRLDSGAPTQIIRVDEPPALEEYRRFVNALIIDGAVEVPAATGLTGGAPAQKGAPGAGPLSPHPTPPDPSSTHE